MSLAAARLCVLVPAALLLVASALGLSRPAAAQDSARLLATAGVAQVEGAAGGGLAPWAVIAGYGSRDAIGGAAHATYVRLSDFQLDGAGAAIGLDDRLELSYAHDSFDTGAAGGRLGLGDGFRFGMEVVGAKLRLFGKLVYDQDSWLPQVSAGVLYKAAAQATTLRAVGARSPDGADFYLAATRLFLAQSLLTNVTVLATKANQLGLLGFGGPHSDGYTAQVAASAALLLSRHVAIGAEVRTKPDLLPFAHEGPAGDVFAAYFLDKSVSVTVAAVDMGPIADQGNQPGGYISLVGSF